MTLRATRSATSSPGSAAGAMRSGSPGGPTTDPSGPGAVPVSRFRARDRRKALPMSGTCGPLFSSSLPSAALQQHLANKLRVALDGSGSPEYALIWSQWRMPSGAPICRLRASARRTSGNGSGGWHTPRATDTHEPTSYKSGGKRIPSNKTLVTGWLTPTSLAGWPTPMSNPSSREKRRSTGGPDLNMVAQLMGWPTPTATRCTMSPEGAARDTQRRGRNNKLGTTAALSLAPMTAPGGSLNPAFSRWLMGVPGRLGQLRAYGNAICPQVAAVFIRAYRDVRHHA